MKIKKIVKFISYVFTPIAIAGLSALLLNMDTYKVINKPPLSPPGWLFPIIWSILYLLMGISLYIVQKNDHNSAQKTFWIQFTLNIIWSFIFFGLKWYLLGALWIVLILYFVFKMLKKFKEINKTAYLLQLPYTIWLFIALYLAVGVTILN